MALELLLLCMRMLYFCMAAEKVGALVRMVLIVIKVGAGLTARAQHSSWRPCGLNTC